MTSHMWKNRKKQSKTNGIASVIFVVVLFFTNWLQAQINPDAIQITAWEQFNDSYGNNWTLRWNSETGTPAAIYDHETIPYSGTAEEIARDFLSDNRSIFKMSVSLDELVVKKIIESSGLTHVRFNQTYQGIDVHSGEYFVHFDSQGRIYMANGRYFPNLSLSVSPTITNTEAISYAVTNLDIDGTTIDSSFTELVIYPTNGQAILAWKVVLRAIPSGVWMCFIDALDGQTVTCEDILMRAEGIGNVYPRDPENSPLTQDDIHRLNC